MLSLLKIHLSLFICYWLNAVSYIFAKRLMRQRHAEASRENMKGTTEGESVRRKKEGVTSAHPSYDSFYPPYLRLSNYGCMLAHPENAASFILPVSASWYHPTLPSCIRYLRMKYLSARYVDRFEECNGSRWKVRKKEKERERGEKDGGGCDKKRKNILFEL